MFSDKNHIHAIATVLGTLGGFQEQPAWFAAAAKTSVWQILMATVLVYQGGGNLDIFYSLVVASVFFFVMKITSYVEFGDAKLPDHTVVHGKVVHAPAAQATEAEAENFFARRR